MPDAATAEQRKEGIVYALLARSLKEDPARSRESAAIKGVAEETTTGVHRLYELQREGRARFPPST